MNHIDNWTKYPDNIKQLFSFVIIDDGSRVPLLEVFGPETLKELEKTHLDLHIYRVKEDLFCNIAGVRNLGAKVCMTPYLVILDMDTVIDVNAAIALVGLAKDNINKNIAFKFNRKVPDDPKHKKNNTIHPAVCLIRTEDYWKIGGCEEDLVGHYGFTDPCFWYRATGIVSVIEKHDIYLLYYTVGEADIVRNTAHNKKVFLERMKTNNWSNNYIRFNWTKVL